MKKEDTRENREHVDKLTPYGEQVAKYLRVARQLNIEKNNGEYIREPEFKRSYTSSHLTREEILARNKMYDKEYERMQSEKKSSKHNRKKAKNENNEIKQQETENEVEEIEEAV